MGGPWPMKSCYRFQTFCDQSEGNVRLPHTFLYPPFFLLLCLPLSSEIDPIFSGYFSSQLPDTESYEIVMGEGMVFVVSPNEIVNYPDIQPTVESCLLVDMEGMRICTLFVASILKLQKFYLFNHILAGLFEQVLHNRHNFHCIF